MVASAISARSSARSSPAGVFPLASSWISKVLEVVKDINQWVEPPVPAVLFRQVRVKVPVLRWRGGRLLGFNVQVVLRVILVLEAILLGHVGCAMHWGVVRNVTPKLTTTIITIPDRDEDHVGVRVQVQVQVQVEHEQQVRVELGGAAAEGERVDAEAEEEAVIIGTAPSPTSWEGGVGIVLVLSRGRGSGLAWVFTTVAVGSAYFFFLFFLFGVCSDGRGESSRAMSSSWCSVVRWRVCPGPPLKHFRHRSGDLSGLLSSHSSRRQGMYVFTVSLSKEEDPRLEEEWRARAERPCMFRLNLSQYRAFPARLSSRTRRVTLTAQLFKNFNCLSAIVLQRRAAGAIHT